MLIYAEDVASSGTTTDDSPASPAGTPRTAEAEALLGRAAAAFAVERL